MPVFSNTRSAAPFAVTSDGVVLINVDALEALDGAVLSGRALFIGAELKGREKTLARQRLHDVADEVYAKLVGSLATVHPPSQREK